MRYESKCGVGVATHDHQSRAAVAATVLSTISHLAESCSVIGIDEGQFVSSVLFFEGGGQHLCVDYINYFAFLKFPDVVDFCETMANAGKIVVVAALDGTYQRSGNTCLYF